MAIITKGIIGGLNGSIGQIVGYNLKNNSIIRSKPKAKRKGKNKVIRANGSRLLVCVEQWNIIKPALNLIVNTYRPDVTIDYNSYIKTALRDATFTIPKQVNSMSFGSDNLKAALQFSAKPIIQYQDIVIAFQGTFKAVAMDNSVVQKLGYYRSFNNFKTLSTQLANVNNSQFGINFQGTTRGDFLILFYWLESVNTGLKSKMGFSSGMVL